MSEFAVEFQGVSKAYQQATIIDNLHLQIAAGQIVTLIGPSGCGKTTTLKMVNRLIEPTRGNIFVEGEDISRVNPVDLRRRIGYVIQQIGLFPHMTIGDNISLVPRLKGKAKALMARRVEELLDLVGLDPATYRSRYPRELSGGQQQRIGVARALAANPSIILMDEPFSALDPISRGELQDELVRLQEAVNKTIVFVTHDMDEALKIADQIVLMKDGQIVQEATPDQLLRHPKDDFVRDFVGAKRFENTARYTSAMDVMTGAITVRRTQGLASAIDLMRRQRVNGLIVTSKEGFYLGVVGMHEIYENYGNETAQVGDIMATDAAVVGADTEIAEVFARLEAGHRGFLPVLEQNGRLTGVITRASVLRVLTTSYAGEEDGDGSTHPDVVSELA